jgi:hypothetical protein
MAAPILLATCAKAATAAEARYRIDAEITPGRGACVIALDDAALEAVRRVAGAKVWATARFYSAMPAGPTGGDGPNPDLRLLPLTGDEVPLSDVLPGVDAVVMVATTDTGAALAAAAGQACTLRGVMTAGLVLSPDDQAGATVAALRPHARVLMVSADEDDVAGVMTALRT